VANSEQLEILAREAEKAAVFALKGWRWEVFGQHALALLSGGLRVQVGGKHGIVVTETD
jgi:ribonuclease D